MDIITFYLIGFAIALIWFTYDYYAFNVRHGKDVRYIFDDPSDIGYIFLFSLGSWASVLCLLLTNDEKNS